MKGKVIRHFLKDVYMQHFHQKIKLTFSDENTV